MSTTIICSECREQAIRRNTYFAREGWALKVDQTRLLFAHRDGSPLCPEMTSRGYQPCLPLVVGDSDGGLR